MYRGTTRSAWEGLNYHRNGIFASRALGMGSIRYLLNGNVPDSITERPLTWMNALTVAHALVM
jgi:hypothetical protein